MPSESDNPGTTADIDALTGCADDQSALGNAIEKVMTNRTTNEPEWTDAEHDEIMRLHIIEGYTISEAKLVVFERRETVNV